ncbi:FAD-dependent 5-carboxymethylaminomethyl-2-thiouridine(34) oxidoreductase MnmC [Massilia sp. PAMC28688]|uniref:FAD-dependent 5-carboxymethylaminomethyl-2-thiouridine(34) oxidoreductase MnmC n=1 Tax=Massilia sp. PAMC28688 TaxID=2861283 RepID=UPI001C628CF9|nr:FAD-dependent 5-carboxymethylaminomethyl-2-thiouridine(34) oxidoreductase MnmC [Massilia sp. PAMC28688]QYF94702.1 FAD-dependent 5-carboxymethylaminomethyl-2-thiouridine(34) oxidoreductase MnmC [Massilia sp. PAMC28688]
MYWQGRAHFTIFDSSFGDGRRFEALCAAWRADPQRSARLHYIALDAGRLPGMHRIPQLDARITLDLVALPLNGALAQLDARLNAIFLRGDDAPDASFARTLARLCEPGAALQAHALTLVQTHALSGAGFACMTDPDGGLRGSFTTRKPPSPWARQAQAERRAIVIGAGLAGSAACERLTHRGWQVTLVERHAHPAGEASGNLAGIYMPLLSRDDNIMTRLTRAAFLYAGRYWEGLDGIAGQACGVLQLARDSGHADVQRAIAAAHHYPPDYARWLDSAEAGAMLGSAAPDGAWLFPRAGWAQPSSVCRAMLARCGDRLTQRLGTGPVTLQRGGAEWVVLNSAGDALAQAPVVVVASGTGARTMAQTCALPLDSVRGQVTHLAQGQVPALPFVLCREAYLTPGPDGTHSLGASYDAHGDPQLRADSQLQNLEKIRSLLGDPGIGIDAPLAGRVGFRCVAPDRLPLVGALPAQPAQGRIERLRDVTRAAGLYGLLGYASRGLTWAPLAAELLASQLDNEPLPLEAELAEALDPARFIVRARRRV